ncbi:MAG: pyruvate kinase [Rhodothermales bacterium]|nr:pyruvate kinase [Rhodothermales bacterium]
MRRTKIVCTLGPASTDLATIRGLVEAGMDVARLNFSHGTHAEHGRRIDLVRQAAREVGRVVAIMQDLQGPKIRIGDVRGGIVTINDGDEIILTADEIKESDGKRVHVSYPALEADVEVGRHILIDDGLIELMITNIRGKDIVTKVLVGGELRSRKGVHLPLMRNTKPSLTEKDLADLKYGLDREVDIVALSFVRRASDIEDLLKHIRAAGKEVSVVAKIEKPEAVTCLDEIMASANGIMVARGDLGIEMPLSQVPGTQKLIIRKCLERAKPVITATQMLESMIDNARPTRAEASDVANAVLDGSDAVMLSGETAVGKYVVRVVEVMSRIIVEAEKHYDLNSVLSEQVPTHDESTDVVTESVAFTAVRMAERTGARAIACLTATGTTARSIARHRPSVPVYAFTDDERVVRRLSLVWGTKGFAIPFQHDTDHGVRAVHEVLKRELLVEEGDSIVITAGMPLPSKGRTNMVHVSRI